MGPQSSDRGSRAGRSSRTLRAKLQWGRDLLIAELCHPHAPAHKSQSLQWGRDLLIAELGEAARGRQPLLRFNGAAIF